MIIATKYTLRINDKGEKFVISSDNLPCPCCFGHLYLKDYRRRKVRWSDVEFEFIFIRVLYCADCKKSHRELPDFLLPYKHYVANVIESVLDGGNNRPVGDDTIRRWTSWFEQTVSHINAVLVLVRTIPSKIRSRALSPLEALRKSGLGWLPLAIRYYVNSGGSLGELT